MGRTIRVIKGPTRDITCHVFRPFVCSQNIPVAVILHPLASAGGNMNNAVVRHLTKVFEHNGMAALTFDFASVSRADVATAPPSPLEDLKDTLAVCKETLKHHSHIVLAGYSYGAFVAGGALADFSCPRQVRGYVGVSYPFKAAHHFCEASVRSEVFDRPLHTSSAEKVFVCGSNDMYCPVSMVDRALETMYVPKTSHVINGATHFWTRNNELELLEKFIAPYVRKLRQV